MVKIKGTCDKKFEAVRKALEQMIKSGCEDKAQLCVYVGDKCVIDLHGSYDNDSNYGPDKIQCVFSSGKSVASIVVALLVEKGLLDYDSKVSKYWPEFGQNGKEEITVADVLRHESGLAWVNHSFKTTDFLPENIKKNVIGEVLEKEPYHEPLPAGPMKIKTPREYHAVTRALVLNEIVRRVDPRQRTIGEILLEDVNMDGVRVGLKDDDLKNVADETVMNNKRILRQSFRPKFFGRGIEQNVVDFVKIGMKAKEQAKKVEGRPPLIEKSSEIGMNNIDKFINQEVIRRGEMPSANVHASARGLAKMAAIMAHRGELNGERIMTEETWLKMHDKEKRAYDGALSMLQSLDNRSNFTQGGVNHFTLDKDATPDERKLCQDRLGYIGWLGLGGSIFMWHPELKIGFAFVPTSLHWFDFANLRGAKLQRLVTECVRN